MEKFKIDGCDTYMREHKIIEQEHKIKELEATIYEVGVFLSGARQAAAVGNYAPIELAINRLKQE